MSDELEIISPDAVIEPEIAPVETIEHPPIPVVEKVLEVRAPAFADAAHSVIDCEIKHPQYGWISTTVMLEGDDRPELVEKLLSGAIGSYVATEPLPPTKAELKLAGVEFAGVMCSATSRDMWGLNAVKEWILSGQAVPFEFDNGNVLVLTQANIAEFEAVWVPFRASFFGGKN